MNLRVVHVAHGWPPEGQGGTEQYAAALCAAQARAGAWTRGWWGERVPAASRGFTASWARPEIDTAFARLCRDLRPDVVHVHHLSGLSLGLPAVARASGARVVLTLHDFWLPCARGQLVDLDGARCPGPEPARCARCLAPALYAPLPARVAARLPLRLGPVRDRARAVADALASVDLVLSPSRHLPARLGLAAEVLPLPLLAPMPAARAAPPGPVRFLFLGALLPTKGPDVALEAFARLPAGAATLTLRGAALPWRGRLDHVDALRSRVAAVPGAVLAPPVPHERVPAVLAEADVLLFPSTWDENHPLVLAEARAAGLRIVASDVPGASEVAPDAVHVEPGSVEAWRRALAAEVRRGRARRPPHPAPDLDTHARALLDRYESIPSPARTDV